MSWVEIVRSLVEIVRTPVKIVRTLEKSELKLWQHKLNYENSRSWNCENSQSWNCEYDPTKLLTFPCPGCSVHVSSRIRGDNGIINFREKEKEILDHIIGPDRYDSRIRPAGMLNDTSELFWRIYKKPKLNSYVKLSLFWSDSKCRPWDLLSNLLKGL